MKKNKNKMLLIILSCICAYQPIQAITGGEAVAIAVLSAICYVPVMLCIFKSLEQSYKCLYLCLEQPCPELARLERPRCCSRYRNQLAIPATRDELQERANNNERTIPMRESHSTQETESNDEQAGPPTYQEIENSDGLEEPPSYHTIRDLRSSLESNSDNEQAGPPSFVLSIMSNDSQA